MGNFSKVMKVKVSRSFPALTHKYFRYFWFGQCISLIGTWMQSTTQGWLVLQISEKNSSFLLGLISALQFTPVMLFSLFAGVIIDRFCKRKILLFTQTALMLVAIFQGILVFTGTIRVWHIALFALFIGCINTLDMPARQAIVVDLVGKENLMNGIALNSTIFNGARIIGPAVAGIVIAYTGIQWGYIINGISFIPVIYGIYKIRIISRGERKEKKILTEIKDGLIYIKGNSELIKNFALVSVMGIFAFNYNVLIPVFAVDILGLSSKGYGALMSILGCGSLVGALTIATRSKRGPKSKLILLSSYMVTSILILIGINKNMYILGILLAFVGLFNIFFSTSANSTIQMKTTDEYRGRVMSVYSLLFTGVAPIGSLFTGAVSNAVGPGIAFILCGVIAMLLISFIALIFSVYKKANVVQHVK